MMSKAQQGEAGCRLGLQGKRGRGRGRGQTSGVEDERTEALVPRLRR